MSTLWEAPQEIVHQINAAKKAHHPHLAHAGIWVLCSDAKALRDNRLVVTQSKKCSQAEHLASGKDFKVIVLMEAWSNLTEAQQKVAVDEALCRCGVRYLPRTVEVNGKKEVLKDELGRVIYGDQVAHDLEGRPRWKINHPDAGLYYPMLGRHGTYCEEAQNVQRSLEGKPLILPTAAPDAALIGVGAEDDEL